MPALPMGGRVGARDEPRAQDPGLPNSLDTIAIQRSIDTEEGHPLGQALRNQKTVKGITVMKWEPRDEEKMLHCDGQNGNPVCGWLMDRQIDEWQIDPELPRTELDCDLPQACYAYEYVDIFVFNQFKCRAT